MEGPGAGHNRPGKTSTESAVKGRAGTPSLPHATGSSGRARPWLQTSEALPTAGPSPGASVFPQLPPKGAESPGDGPASPTGGGGGQRGPGRAGCQAWEDAEVGLEVSVRAQAQGGINSCWSCIIKILLSGAWQSPINPHQGSTQNPLAAAAPCSPGTGSGLALRGESRGPGYGRPWAEPGWARMGTGEGECGQGSGPGLPPGPGIPSTPPPVLGGLRVLPPPLQPLCPGPQHPSSCLPSSLPFSFRLPALLWAAPPPAPILPLLRVVIPWCSPFS